VIGLVELSRGRRRTGHTARLDNFAIRPEFQGQGWGAHLLQEIIAELQSQGIKRIDLIVESDNTRAIRLYQKLGFEIEGTLRKYFKRANQSQFVDDYLMAIIFD
jgi:putative acetyltransferase